MNMVISFFVVDISESHKSGEASECDFSGEFPDSGEFSDSADPGEFADLYESVGSGASGDLG